MTSIEDLPPELLVEIFSHYIESEGHALFLYNVAPVCKLWNDVSSSALLWRSIDGKEWSKVKDYSKRGLLYHTKCLKMPEFYRNPHDLSEVLPSIRELKALDISLNVVDALFVMSVTEYCRKLERLVMQGMNLGYRRMTLHELDPIFTVCGPRLIHLDLSFCCLRDGQQVITAIAEKCTSLEEFRYHNIKPELTGVDNAFPIHRLEKGCPRLHLLEFSCCDLITASERECVGFKNMRLFYSSRSDFHGFDFQALLKNSADLEHLYLESNKNFVFANICDVPSDKLKTLEVDFRNADGELKTLVKSVDKWKNTLLKLDLWGWKCDITEVLETLLHDNACPKIRSLLIERMDVVKMPVLKTFVEKCRDLSYVTVVNYGEDNSMKFFRNRQEVETILDFF